MGFQVFEFVELAQAPCFAFRWGSGLGAFGLKAMGFTLPLTLPLADSKNKSPKP